MLSRRNCCRHVRIVATGIPISLATCEAGFPVARSATARALIIEKKFGFRAPSRSGDDVVRCDGLRKAYGARTIHDGLSLTVRRKERWARTARSSGCCSPSRCPSPSPPGWKPSRSGAE